jgi:hypothetical protein
VLPNVQRTLRPEYDTVVTYLFAGCTPSALRLMSLVSCNSSSKGHTGVHSVKLLLLLHAKYGQDLLTSALHVFAPE